MVIIKDIAPKMFNREGGNGFNRTVYHSFILFIIVSSLTFDSLAGSVRDFYPQNGIMVSVEELDNIRMLAESGVEPYHSNLNEFLKWFTYALEDAQSWAEISGEVVIANGSSGQPTQLSADGARLVYGAALAWHLTGQELYAEMARRMILSLTNSHGFRDFNRKSFHWGAQGILNLARGGTPYIYAADLLNNWSGWSPLDKHSFQLWLRDEMYPKVAWASRVRKNNWGVAGSFSASVIAFYLMDQPDWMLTEFAPDTIRLRPVEAFEVHNTIQLGRQNTSEEWQMDAKTLIWGIMPNGAIPEEIRRGKDPVDGDFLPSRGSGTHYTMTYIEHLTAHAEFLRRRGDNSLFDYMANDGSGSLLKAFLFVVANQKGAHCFTQDRRNALYLAYGYYKHAALLQSILDCGPANIYGQRLALFGRLTHPLKIEY